MAQNFVKPKKFFNGIRSASMSFVVTALFVSSPVLAQQGEDQPEFGLACDIDSVTVDGQETDMEDFKIGFRWEMTWNLPPYGTLPTDTVNPEPGVDLSFWDLPDQFELKYTDPDGNTDQGAAGASRWLQQDAPPGVSNDAIGGEAIAFPFAVGDTSVDLFGFVFGDDSGNALSNSQDLPEQITTYQWNNHSCYIQGIDGASMATVQAAGKVLFIANRNEVGGWVIDLVPGGGAEAVSAAVEFAHAHPVPYFIALVREVKIKVPEDYGPIIFNKPYQGTESALQEIHVPIAISGPNVDLQRDLGAGTLFRLATVGAQGKLTIGARNANTSIRNFSSPGDGGVFLSLDNGEVKVFDTEISNIRSLGDGSVIHASGTSDVTLVDCTVTDNVGEGNGTLFVSGEADLTVRNSQLNGNTVEGAGSMVYRDENAFLTFKGNTVMNNQADEGGTIVLKGGSLINHGAYELNILGFLEHNTFEFNDGGPDILVDLNGDLQGQALNVDGNEFLGQTNGPRIQYTEGSVYHGFNLVEQGGEQVAIGNSGAAQLIGNILQQPQQQQKQLSDAARPKPLALCDGSSLTSLGANISTDDSCDLDHVTDLPNTDPLLDAPDADGHQVPLPNSPAIDLGPPEMLSINGRPVLPCGYKDIRGMGRPQDGNGDGIAECDSGPVEVQGPGQIQAGHSAAFYNAQRNNEGEFVEVLANGIAVVYTFSFNPEGDGLAWFTGTGTVVGNSIVIDELFQPVGTSWGGDFESDAVSLEDVGSMSMVMPGCTGADPAGSVIYSGAEELGFEPLMTRAQRLTDILGCGQGVAPHANAGLSGTFYDFERSGEGLVIQYLPDGQVVAIMFTFGLSGEQMWMIGQGAATDKTITMNVLYPTAFTAWGQNFVGGDVLLESWGSWTLTWTGCNTLDFSYNSTVPNYGNGQRSYVRLTQLLDSQCP